MLYQYRKIKTTYIAGQSQLAFALFSQHLMKINFHILTYWVFINTNVLGSNIYLTNLYSFAKPLNV